MYSEELLPFIFPFADTLKSFGDKTVDLFANKKEDVTDETDQKVLIAESVNNFEVKADEMSTFEGILIDIVLFYVFVML